MTAGEVREKLKPERLTTSALNSFPDVVEKLRDVALKANDFDLVVIRIGDDGCIDYTVMPGKPELRN
jgi:hypothetical protein